jgi:tripartite-type tricarboxylate transporter receptor subunit TctC
MPDLKFIRIVLATIAFALIGSAACGQPFPSKPVHILVPYAAGGAVDVLARTLGQSLSKIWGSNPSSKIVPAPAASLPRRR